MDQKVLLKVDGMDCSNCAQSITRTLVKEGLERVQVDFISGEVTFQRETEERISNAVQAISRLGYHVVTPQASEGNSAKDTTSGSDKVNWKFIVSLIFTIPLLLHMFLPFPFFHSPLFQLSLSIPVMIIGIIHFGKSAYYSLLEKVPNMDVLIITGSSAAFIYSVAGLIKFYGTPEVMNYLFFETSAAIITLVLLGNVIEKRSVKQTTNAISELRSLQPDKAKKILTTQNGEEIVECHINELMVGDIVSLNTGDRIPLDGKIITGDGSVNESMITGESRLISKSIDDSLTGGTIVEQGNFRLRVEHVGSDTVLAKIIDLVKKAQHSKPSIQKLGDRISGVFVPVVIGISVLTFLLSYLSFGISVSKSLMHSIAVLVIACTCAVGLATPTAIMVGLGKAAREGILIKGGSTIELLAGIKTIIFDKTGTLTTGNFRIKNIHCIDGNETLIRSLLYSLEKNSSHPIARSIQKELKSSVSDNFNWKEIKEDKGIGINATDPEGNLYSAGSFQMVRHFHDDHSHDIYLLKNNKLIATVDLEDEVKPGVSEVIKQLKERGLRVIMLSGDRKQNCEVVAAKTGIDEIFYEKLPSEKLEILDGLMKENPVAMVGDGINDAPALTKATVGISLSDASATAIQSSQMILLAQHDMQILIRALRISEQTYSTIKQNLFWAFFYNIVAIPIAATGMLSPIVGAMSMAFSDVIVIGNSLRLRIRKL